ncbi:MAG: radical SAM family heme chaperone HemW [Prevotellaceae bacterium]|nr:radical SAM family heme chaperone HemW [Prevotellaceae bacterium]
MKGIYIHIPFCKQLCAYCDFYSSISLKEKDAMLHALLHEMALRRDYFPASSQGPVTLYFGGGTPSLLAPAELKLLLQTAQTVFNVEELSEVTLEANPDDLSPAYLEALLSLGINRLSIGIQSFSITHLQWMNRRHTAAQAINSVKQAREAGFANLTIDLIYGFPSLRMEEWKQTLMQALTLDVPHISAYHLTIEPHTLFGKQAEKGLLQPLDDEESERQFLLLHHTLTQAGYVHYEVSNFARPGYEAQHNSAYWQQQPYIGIGPSAHSFNGVSRQWNKANNRQYTAALAQGLPFFESETLTPTMRYNEYILTGLRTATGVSPASIREHFGEQYAGYFSRHIEPYLQTGKLKRKDEKIYIPPQHFFVSDAIIESLFLVTG